MASRLVVTTSTGTSLLGAFQYNAEALYIGQAYTEVETGLLDMIDVYIARVGTPIGNFYAELYSGGTLGSGTLLGTTNSINNLTVSTKSGYIRMTFLTPIAVTAGQQYWFKFISTSAVSTSNYLRLKGSNTDVYPGNAYGFAGSGSYTLVASDVAMYIYHKTSSVYVNYISGNDSTGSGDILAPVKTLARGLELQLQGDEVRVMENETMTSAIILPVRSSRMSTFTISGVVLSKILQTIASSGFTPADLAIVMSSLKVVMKALPFLRLA